jgi:hypothetical protein
MISYLLANGKAGNLTDPRVLRIFYTRLYYHATIHKCPRAHCDYNKTPQAVPAFERADVWDH